MVVVELLDCAKAKPRMLPINNGSSISSVMVGGVSLYVMNFEK